jgi:hypothetical protein
MTLFCSSKLIIVNQMIDEEQVKDLLPGRNSVFQGTL